jgi:tripartite-type tricarboxylate transporter receptor subunit TctC
MFSPRHSFLALIFGGFAALAAAAPLAAQTPSWPTRTVRFLLPLGPGSGVDITARLFADKLSAKWGQPVVVENRPGGDAFVAITAVTSAHDDHILLFAPASSFTAHPLLHAKLPYDINELAPIARVTSTLIGVAVPTSLGVNTLKEFVAKAKAEPGKLNYASATGANDLLFLAWLKTENLNMAKVPYRDTVQAITDLSESRVHAYVAAYAILRAQVQAGKVKMLALTNTERAAELPDIPPAREAGYPALDFDGLVGLFGTRELAPAVRDRIAADIKAIAADPAVRTRLGSVGQVVTPGTPAEFSAALAKQRETVARIGKTLEIKPAGQ